MTLEWGCVAECPIGMDELFDVLGDIHRRRLLVSLLEEESMDISSLIPSDIGYAGQERIAVRIELHHVHLPKLEELGIIDWNRDTNDVSRGPAFEDTRPFVKCLDDHAAGLPDGWT